MEPFFARIRVLLDTPANVDGDTTTKPLSGFFRNIGVMAADPFFHKDASDQSLFHLWLFWCARGRAL